MRKFHVRAIQDDRIIVHEADSLAHLQARITSPNHEIAGEVLDGGMVVEPLPDGLRHYSYLTHLLLRHGEEFDEYLVGFLERHQGDGADQPDPLPQNVRRRTK